MSASSLHFRVGDLERTAVCQELSAQYGLGRITPDELEQRLELAVRAQTRGELAGLVIDLPPDQGPARPGPAAAPERPAPPPATLARHARPAAWAFLSLGSTLMAVLMLLGLASATTALIIPALIGGMATFVAGFGVAQTFRPQEDQRR